MLITVKKCSNVEDGDLIALTKNKKFIGYAIIKSILEDCMVLDVGKDVSKTFYELTSENIPYEFEMA